MNPRHEQLNKRGAWCPVFAKDPDEEGEHAPVSVNDQPVSAIEGCVLVVCPLHPLMVCGYEQDWLLQSEDNMQHSVPSVAQLDRALNVFFSTFHQVFAQSKL